MKSAHNVAHQHSEHELSPDDFEPEPMAGEEPRSQLVAGRRSNLGLYALALLLSGAAAGLGAYAWQLMNEKAQLKSDVARLEQVRDETQARVAQLVQQNGEQEARSLQADSEREQLRWRSLRLLPPDLENAR